MKGLHKRIFAVLLTIIFSISLVSPAFAEESTSSVDLGINASAAFLMEFNTGKIIYQDNADEALPIASMTKMMSAYIIEEAIKNGELSWDDKVTVSSYAHRISQNTSLSNVPLLEGVEYTVEELFEAALMYSANGATIAIAEELSGSEQKFVDKMNAKAEELGMKDTTFVNTTGLNNSSLLGMHPENTGATDENIASARDMAVLAYHLIHDFPKTLEVSSRERAVFREGQDGETNMDNWNWMLPGLVFGYEGTDGLKTGSTDAAGSCFTGTAERNGTRLISVVLNTADRSARFTETKKLFDFGFNNFEVVEAFPEGYQGEGYETVTSSNGRSRDVEVATDSTLYVLLEKGSSEEFEAVYDITLDDIEAPAEAGTVVGTMSVKNTTSDDYGYLLPNHGSVNVVTTADLDKANFVVRGFRSVGSFFGSLVDKVTGLF